MSDIAIIGAGSAGFAAAIRAVELGGHATLVGDGAIGGTCVNVGCVPSKTLIRAVEGLHLARAASRFTGISAEGHLSDWSSLLAQKDDLVSKRGLTTRDLAETIFPYLTTVEGLKLAAQSFTRDVAKLSCCA